MGLYAPIAMPSGTASTAAITNPPTTRHTVIATSLAKPKRVKSDQPSCSMAHGSARNVRGTNPPSVATLQSATKTAKNAMPSASRRAGAIGASGVTTPRSLDEARVGERGHVGHRLEDADLEQQVGRLLAELSMLAAEEFLVGGLVLPAQVF